MPNAPEKNDEHDSFEVPPEKGHADRQQKQRCQNKAPFEAVEQRAIAIGAYHSRQVMSHRAKRRDEEINVLRTPARLGKRENRKQEQRRADVENQVTPGI